MNEIDQVKLELLKTEIENLLEEYARSMEVKLKYTFNPGTFSNRLFELNIVASPISAEDVGTIREQESANEIYEKNWKECSYKFNLEPSLLGKVFEVESTKQRKKVRYKIIGLNTTKRNKRYCLALLDIDTGKVWSGHPAMIRHGKEII